MVGAASLELLQIRYKKVWPEIDFANAVQAVFDYTLRPI
jgi:hypothetical protein